MKKWWGFRHIRYFYLKVRFAWWWSGASQMFLVPNQRDLDYLDDVWAGKV